LLIIGQITPSAPASSARMISPGEFHDTRTSEAACVVEIACSMPSISP